MTIGRCSETIFVRAPEIPEIEGVYKIQNSFYNDKQWWIGNKKTKDGKQIKLQSENERFPGRNQAWRFIVDGKNYPEVLASGPMRNSWEQDCPDRSYYGKTKYVYPDDIVVSGCPFKYIVSGPSKISGTYIHKLSC